jgi:hypothetical protein
MGWDPDDARDRIELAHVVHGADFAVHISDADHMSPQENSLTSLVPGRSDWEAILVNMELGTSSGGKLQIPRCARDDKKYTAAV